MTDETTDAREFEMTKTEASCISRLWPERMRIIQELQRVEGEIGGMKEELAARLSGVAGFEITHEQITNMDWSKRKAIVNLPKKGSEDNGRILPLNRLPADAPKES